MTILQPMTWSVTEETFEHFMWRVQNLVKDQEMNQGHEYISIEKTHEHNNECFYIVGFEDSETFTPSAESEDRPQMTTGAIIV